MVNVSLMLPESFVFTAKMPQSSLLCQKVSRREHHVERILFFG
jgi:hypothetical protein